MAILSLYVAMAMTACGGNADTTEATETTEREESLEDNAQAKTEDETPTEEETAEFGVNSTSSYGVLQLLRDDMKPEWYGAEDFDEYNQFTGRFAYPELTQSDIFDSAVIYERTDYCQSINAWNF